MTTGTVVVQRALQNLGVHSALQPASPESLDNGFEKLNGMIAEWQDEDIDTGAVPLEVIGDDLCEPLGAKNGIIYNLALLLAPDHPGAQVSSELKRQAKLTLGSIKRKWQVVTIPKVRARETLPTGQGNRQHGRFLDNSFFQDGDELG